MENTTIFICYATCADEVELVQMRELSNTLQYSFVMQLVQMRLFHASGCKVKLPWQQIFAGQKLIMECMGVKVIQPGHIL